RCHPLEHLGGGASLELDDRVRPARKDVDRDPECHGVLPVAEPGTRPARERLARINESRAAPAWTCSAGIGSSPIQGCSGVSSNRLRGRRSKPPHITSATPCQMPSTV